MTKTIFGNLPQKPERPAAESTPCGGCLSEHAVELSLARSPPSFWAAGVCHQPEKLVIVLYSLAACRGYDLAGPHRDLPLKQPPRRLI